MKHSRATPTHTRSGRAPAPSDRPTDALTFLRHRYVGRGDDALAAYEAAGVALNVGQMLYDRRVASGLSQAALAARAGTTQSAISRLEGADYDGHSLSMLARLAHALGCRVRVEFV